MPVSGISTLRSFLFVSVSFSVLKIVNRCWNENNKYYHCMDRIATAINLYNRNHRSVYIVVHMQKYMQRKCTKWEMNEKTYTHRVLVQTCEF